ncbi:hypothetical protein, partial [Heyndrickxia oleronia]|uniref:hypothetical protein n=1 Tax=Heyndrickxia oleronia TaxID=38875 RepID=UPI00311A81E0
IAFLFQVMIWSGFTLAVWLSDRDHLIYRIIVFIVFFYLAFLLARIIVKSNRVTFFITLSSLSIYFLLQFIFQEIFPSPFS